MTAESLADVPDDEPPPDAELGRLLRGLALSERFHFYVAVCETPRIADALLDELAAKLPAEREAEVRFVRLDPYAKHEDFDVPLSVDEVVASALEPLVYPPEENRRHGVVHVLDASRAAPEDEKAFRWLFGRMNERRNHITRALGGELILLATPYIEQLFVEAAPDFWSIRSDTYVVRGGAFEARSRVRPEVPSPTARRAGHERLGVAPPVLAAEPLPPSLLESAGEVLSTRPPALTTASEASAKAPPRSRADEVVARFKPFLQFVRETWSVPPPGDLSDTARTAEVVDGVDVALNAGWAPRPGKQTRRPWRHRPWSSYSPEELAAAAQAAGRTELACRIYRAILGGARGDGGADFDPSIARVVLLLAALEIERGRVEAARAVVSGAEEMGAPRRMDYLRVFWWLQGLGLFYRCLPDTERALEKFGASLAVLEFLSNEMSVEGAMLAEGLVLAAESALALGAFERAREWSGKALSLLRKGRGRETAEDASTPTPTGKLLLKARLTYAEASGTATAAHTLMPSLELAKATQLVDAWRGRTDLDDEARELAVRAYEARARVLEYKGDRGRADLYRRRAHALASRSGAQPEDQTRDP